MSGQILQQDGNNRMVELSVDRDLSWGRPTILQTVAAFDYSTVTVLKIDTSEANTTQTLFLSHEEMRQLIQAYQVYQEDIARWQAEREAEEARQRALYAQRGDYPSVEDSGYGCF